MKKGIITSIFVLFVFSLSFGLLQNWDALAQDTSEESDVELLIKTKTKVAGKLKKSGTNFTAKDIQNIFETDLYINDKHINVKVGYGKRKGEISIIGKDQQTGEIINISDLEAESLKQDLELILGEKQIGTNDLEKMLIRTFNLLSSWPSSMAVIVDPTQVTIPDECGITYPDGISENICPYVNESHIGSYVTTDEYCGWAKYSGIPIIKLDAPTAWMDDVEHNVGGENCFGRCGKGCIGDGEPNNSVNIYTQDCFDHDLCAENEGTLDAGCNWMFIFAIDDFFYGPICPSLDLIFVIDTTGSMWDDIANVKAAANEIVNTIDTEISDYRVAVVDYRDFPINPYGGAGDYPYHVVLPFSSDKSAIIAAIQGLSLGWGADWQESVYSALTRAINTEGLGEWRTLVKKSIILMGDAPPHDPEPFTGYTATSVAAAAEAVDPAIIYPVVIGTNPTTTACFTELAEKTNGKVFTASAAEDVVEAVIEAIGGAVEPENNPPVCDGAVASVTEIWPPNHKMVSVNILNVADPDGDSVSITITGITQDEPVLVSEIDETSPDGEGVGTDTALIRAERLGEGNGRVYSISFTASDNLGGVCSGRVFVGVPHDEGINTICMDNGQFYDSTIP